eukprot:CAMPEP_0184386730 /NCGR_PEP_ID=MMETSP0007-20130409/10062_1 /TAXON_ID=97485 /ORGANISM="Prymnesium parvum, Strain Texoma1" /LENGTH=45 /DNA_ID= /DNA_START= /DNA_END= /DNA_ORIENTATION=
MACAMRYGVDPQCCNVWNGPIKSSSAARLEYSGSSDDVDDHVKST